MPQAAHRLAASLAKQGRHDRALEALGPFFCVTRKGKARFDILHEVQEDSQQDKVREGVWLVQLCRERAKGSPGLRAGTRDGRRQRVERVRGPCGCASPAMSGKPGDVAGCC